MCVSAPHTPHTPRTHKLVNTRSNQVPTRGRTEIDPQLKYRLSLALYFSRSSHLTGISASPAMCRQSGRKTGAVRQCSTRQVLAVKQHSNPLMGESQHRAQQLDKTCALQHQLVLPWSREDRERTYVSALHVKCSRTHVTMSRLRTHTPLH